MITFLYSNLFKGIIIIKSELVSPNMYFFCIWHGYVDKFKVTTKNEESNYYIYIRVKYVFILINIPTFRFSPFKIFLQLLVPIKFSITTFAPYF